MWLEALGLLVGGLLGATIFMAVDYFLSEDKLVEEVEEQYPDAFKLLIKEKKKNAVNVGIFDEDNEHLDDLGCQRRNIIVFGFCADSVF